MGWGRLSQILQKRVRVRKTVITSPVAEIRDFERVPGSIDALHKKEKRPVAGLFFADRSVARFGYYSRFSLFFRIWLVVKKQPADNRAKKTIVNHITQWNRETV